MRAYGPVGDNASSYCTFSQLAAPKRLSSALRTVNDGMEVLAKVHEHGIVDNPMSVILPLRPRFWDRFDCELKVS
jgi:hypothetical protein